MWLKNKKFYKWLGYFIGIGAIFFVLKTVKETGLNWEQVTLYINGVDTVLLLCVLLLYVVVMLIGAVIWSLIINTLSQNQFFNNFDRLILVHSRSNIGKYIPGNFMQFVGRNLLGNKLGYTHSNLVLSTLIEVFLSIVVGILLIMLVLFSGLSNINIYKVDFGPVFNRVILFFVLISVIALTFVFNQKAAVLIDKSKLVMKNRLVFFWILLAFVFAYVILGVCNTVIYFVLDNEIKFIDFFNLLVVYILSWTIGFILPGPPGGLGVREFIFITVLSSAYPLSIITLVALILRSVNVVGDLLYSLLAETYLRLKK